MALADDLLEHARHLARREPTRPRQASLRRAVSAAYYALFHLLAAEGVRMVSPSRPPGLRAQVGRAFAHADMRSVCRQFAGLVGLSEQLRPLVSQPIEPGLISVARSFLEAQAARHAADYDVAQSFTRLDVLEMIGNVQSAFENWERARTTPNATVFLTALLLHRQWGRS